MKRFLGLWGLLLPLAVFAQREVMVSGLVTDDETGMPVIGAYVVIKNSVPVRGTATGVDGTFSLMLDADTTTILVASYVGYQKKEVEVTGTGSPLHISLEQMLMDEVVVRPRDNTRPVNEFSAISARNIAMASADKLPGGLNDIGRMAQNFAGVQKSDDQSNEIVVRGNNPGTVLWRIDGVDVPNPNHFAELGSSGGPLSMLNGNTIRESDFYTGAFPAAFGNATGAAFDVRLRAGGKERIRYLGQVGFNGFEAMVDGPLRKGSEVTFMVNYRNTNLKLVERMNLIDFDLHMGVPDFNDLFFKVNAPAGKWGDFSVFGITGFSKISMEASRIIEKSNASPEALENALTEGADEHLGSTTGVYGLNHILELKENLFMQSSVSLTHSRNYFNRDTLDESYTPHANYGQDFAEKRLAFKSGVEYRPGDQHLLKVGGRFTHILFGFNKEAFLAQYNSVATIMENKGSAGLLQGFAQYKFTSANNRFTVSPGIYQQYFTLNEDLSVEPRLSISYAPHSNHLISFGAGKHSQLLPATTYFGQAYGGNNEAASPNRDLEMQKSLHYVLGYKWQLPVPFTLNSEFYYQQLYDVPVSLETRDSWSLINEGFFEESGIRPVYMQSTGKGRNYGVDLTLEYHSDAKWQGMLTASLFRSEYQGSDKVWRRSVWDGGYSLNAIAGRNIEIGGYPLNITLKANWAGGKRFQPIDMEASRLAGYTVRDYENDFTEKYPDYFKMDLKVGYKFPTGKFSHEFVLDFQNITNRKNILFETYSPYLDAVKTSHQLEFIPVFQYRIWF